MSLDSPLEGGARVDTASRTISGSSLTSMTVVLQERSLSQGLGYDPGTRLTTGWSLSRG